MAGVHVWLFTSRMAEVLQLASMWSGRQCVDVDVYAIEDTPIDRTAAQMRSEAFAIVLATALGQHVGPLPLAEFLQGSLDTRYRILLELDRVRVEWDTGRPATPLPAVDHEPRR
jgi:hypothetical protein